MASPTYIDSFAWGVSPDDKDRYFADYPGGQVNCFSPLVNGMRCFNAGAFTGYALIPNTTLWIK